MLTRALPRTIWTSRRASVGIHGSPGSTSRLPAWWTAEDWTAEVRATVRRHRDVCRAHHVEADTVLAVARGMATYADFRTGRDCRPTNERLVLEVRVSLSTVQRARRVLKALGFVVELVAGRSVLTRDERLAAHRRGSSHRRLAAEFALCSRRNRPTYSPTGRRRPQRRRSLVERDTPPGSPVGRKGSSVRTTHLRPTTETRKAASRPAPTQGVGPGRRRQVDPRTRRLVAAVQRRMTWLAAVPASRLAPLLSPYARANWTSDDVQRAAADAAAARGWKILLKPDHPPAYLATLLREVDVEDRPGALDEQIAAAEAAQRRYERQLLIGTPCPHGQPAGDVPSPLLQHRACPLCRAAAEQEAASWP